MLYDSKKFLDFCSRKNLSYSNSLKLLREVLRMRREKIFFSLEFSDYGVILYSETGIEISIPVYKEFQL